MSQTLKELYGLLGITSIWTSVYHPQTDGLVEGLETKTLKSMIRKFIQEDSPSWDKWLASTEFSPFELFFWQKAEGRLGPN